MLNPCAEVEMADARVRFLDNKRVKAKRARVRVEAESVRVREEAESVRVHEKEKSVICDNLF